VFVRGRARAGRLAEEAAVTLEQTGDGAAARPYRTLLLRVWRGGDSWRAVVEDPRSGQRHGFADLAGLLAFLDNQFGDGATVRTEDPGRCQSQASEHPE
jgi:hypothetical protein